MTEMGHATRKAPSDFWVLLHGRPAHFTNVTGVDPRFELTDVPKPDWVHDKFPRFLGQADYSLPLVDPAGQPAGFLASHRHQVFPTMSGSLYYTPTPEGVVCPADWADKAIIVGDRD